MKVSLTEHWILQGSKLSPHETASPIHPKIIHPTSARPYEAIEQRKRGKHTGLSVTHDGPSEGATEYRVSKHFVRPCKPSWSMCPPLGLS